MNIFFVNPDPRQCARELPDIYCGSNSWGGKMIVESAQLLANAYPAEMLSRSPLTQKGTVRKHSYVNHPSSKWTISSKTHWWWLLDHAFSMVEEKIFRGGVLHFTSCFLDWCVYNEPPIEDIGWQDPPKCMDEEFKRENTKMAYQNYLKNGKTHLSFTWTKRLPPEWWTK